MQTLQVALGLLLLLGFFVSQILIQTYSTSLILIVWMVILVVGFYSLAKDMKVKWSEDVNIIWWTTTVFLILGTLLPLLNIIPASPYVVVSSWLILLGAAMFSTGYEMKWSMTIYTGLIWLFVGLTIFISSTPSYFAIAGIALGVPLIVTGWMMKR